MESLHDNAVLPKTRIKDAVTRDETSCLLIASFVCHPNDDSFLETDRLTERHKAALEAIQSQGLFHSTSKLLNQFSSQPFAKFATGTQIIIYNLARQGFFCLAGSFIAKWKKHCKNEVSLGETHTAVSDVG